MSANFSIILQAAHAAPHGACRVQGLIPRGNPAGRQFDNAGSQGQICSPVRGGAGERQAWGQAATTTRAGTFAAPPRTTTPAREPPAREPPEGGRGRPGPGGGPEARIEAAAMRLARLIGRQIAREHFEAGRAANDNAPEDEAGER